ncbi:flagellar assembly protein FliH [Methylomonas methanica]|uniref:Flagellar assembly protein FliH n=1 Tax=Methylomonas methanica (strain DSM 25384 / MC09) TaxID=857087 RepID=G0A1V1_METMM|nr:flagellar assembly protein FliH [Methylomonas methanica]AEG01334.1 Flagellar assembly protein FliH/Type III secretion system HrpE [Methylomonas methanica MC09]
MSSSNKVSKFSSAELDALDTWKDLEVFGAPRSENVEVEQATQVLTVDEIEAMQKQAYDEAFEQGRQQGFEQGSKQGFEQGQKQGLEAGHKKGYEESQHLLQKQLAELNLLLESLAEPFKHLDEEVESELVKLVIAIAGQIIRREIKLDPGQIVGVIREAVNVLPLATQKITLNLHPEDADLVRSVLKLDENPPPWRLQDNPLITRGGCTVETDISTVDATLENRLSAVIATLLGGERQRDAAR